MWPGKGSFFEVVFSYVFEALMHVVWVASLPPACLEEQFAFEAGVATKCFFHCEFVAMYFFQFAL